MDRARRIVEPGGAGPAGHEHVAGGEKGGVHLAAGVRHRSGVRPRRVRLIEIDDLGRVSGRVVAAACVEDFPRQVHDGGSVVAPRPEVAPRPVGPSARAGHVQPARRLLFAGIEDAPVGRHEQARVPLQRQVRRRELPPVRPVPHLRNRVDRHVLVGAADGEDFAVRQGGVGGIPSPHGHGRPNLPGVGHRIEQVGVGQTVPVGDVPAGNEQPTVGEEVVARAKQPRGTRHRREATGSRIPHLRVTDASPAQHRAVGQQVNVELYDGRRKHRRPLADLRFGGRRGRGRGRGRRRTPRRRVDHRQGRMIAGHRIFTARERAVAIAQLRGIRIQQQAEVRGGSVEPSLHHGRHVPRLESRGLVDALRVHRGADVRLRQRDVIATTPIGRPPIDAVVGVARRSRRIGVPIDDLVSGDGISRISGGVTLREIEAQRRARNGGSCRNARQVELHHDRVGDRVVRPRVDIEGRPRRIIGRVEIQVRIAGGGEHRRLLPRRWRRCRGRVDHREEGAVARDGVLPTAEITVPIPQRRRIGIHQQAKIRGGRGEPSLDQRSHVPLFEPGRLVDPLRVHGSADVRLRQRNVVVATGIRCPGIRAVVGVAGRPAHVRVLVEDLVYGDCVGRIRGGIALREVEIQCRARDRSACRNAREVELQHAGVGDLMVRPRIHAEHGRRPIVGRIDVQEPVGGGTDDDGSGLYRRGKTGNASRSRDRTFVLARHEGEPDPEPQGEERETSTMSHGEFHRAYVAPRPHVRGHDVWCARVVAHLPPLWRRFSGRCGALPRRPDGPAPRRGPVAPGPSTPTLPS